MAAKSATSKSSSPAPTPNFKPNPGQRRVEPLLTGPQRHTCLVGGARSGKTFLFTRATVVRGLRVANSRHAILRFRANAVWKSIGLDTLPRVMETCFPGVGLAGPKKEGYFLLPNGSQIWLGGLDEKERVEAILGQEYATIYFNECSQIPYSSVIVARTRLAQQIEGLRQRAYYDLNPTGVGHWTNREFGEHRNPSSGEPLEDPDNYRRAFVNPEDNAENLSPEYLASLRGLPEKQRRRFYDGLYVADLDGALWTLERLEQCRISKEDLPPLTRIVVAIDPSGARGPEDKRSDEIGIVVAGKATDGRAYVLEDLSCRLGPAGWARQAVDAYHRWSADAIVGETNFGGAMVAHTIRTEDPNTVYREVTASRGKWVRAEPIAALYEEKIDRVRHVGRFPDLEDQQCAFAASGYTGERSPDRADALVWALTELMGVNSADSFIEFMQGQLRGGQVSTEPTPSPALPWQSAKPPEPTTEPGPSDPLEAYKRTLAGLAKQQPNCKVCGRPVLGNRVSDGVDIWHPNCA